jgi:hypothetical protein
MKRETYAVVYFLKMYRYYLLGAKRLIYDGTTPPFNGCGAHPNLQIKMRAGSNVWRNTTMGSSTGKPVATKTLTL